MDVLLQNAAALLGVPEEDMEKHVMDLVMDKRVVKTEEWGRRTALPGGHVLLYGAEYGADAAGPEHVPIWIAESDR